MWRQGNGKAALGILREERRGSEATTSPHGRHEIAVGCVPCVADQGDQSRCSATMQLRMRQQFVHVLRGWCALAVIPLRVRGWAAYGAQAMAAVWPPLQP
jgi:hypothetical protein